MTTANTQVIARVAAAVAGLGLVAMSFAPLANAQTTTTTSTTTTTATATTFARNLTIGSTGADVTALQTWLIAKGFSIPAGATGYFGAQTKAALGAYQASAGITPAAGYFGPITRAQVNAAGGVTTGLPAGCTSTSGYSSTTGMSCAVSTSLPAGCTSTVGFSPTTGVSCSTTTTTTTTTTGPLAGGEGSIDNFKIVGATASSLNAADSDTVYGFEFKASGSDLQVNRVDYDMYLSTAGTVSASTRPWNVFATAKLMRGTTVVATIDASDMSKYSQDGTAGNGNQVYRLRFDSINDVVRNGTTADYYLQLTTQNVISSTNNNNVYTVTLAPQGLRTTDAKGINQYSSSATQSSATVSVSTSASGSLTISTGSDNPQTTTVQANSNSQTSDVTLTTFTLQAKDGDVTIYTIPVAATSSLNTLSDMVRSVKLYQGSTLIDTESYAATASTSSVALKFKNLNIKIPAGSSQTFSVKADVNSVGGQSTVVEGATITLSIPNAGFEAVNTGGNNVSVTGSVTGNAITFRSIGLAVDSAPSSATATATAVGTSGTQQGNFTYVFNATAFGQDIFFSKNGTATVLGALYSNGVSTSSVASSTAITSTADTSSGNANNYVIHTGQTKQITVTVTVPAGTNAPINSVLTGLKYGLTDATASASTTVLNNNYQTPSVYLHS
ncbi:MAG: peptidoglycan-binding protein [Candidatus Paceibacterota bacterium]